MPEARGSEKSGHGPPRCAGAPTLTLKANRTERAPKAPTSVILRILAACGDWYTPRMESVLATLAAAVGALLMSWSFFLYPQEERSIIATLSAWWIRINDLGESAAARNRILIRDVAAALVRWLNSVFGDRLVSTRAIGVSVCLSFSSALTYAGIVAIIDPTPDPANPKIVIVCLPLSYCLFRVAVGQRRVISMVTAMVLASGVVIATIAAVAHNPEPANGLVFLEGAFVALSCDFLVILLARHLVSLTSSLGIITASAVAGISSLLGVLMLGTPIVVMYNRGTNYDTWAALGSAGIANLYAGLVAIAFAALCGILLVQRTFWSFIERPLYALDRFGFFSNRKALFFFGTLLFAFGFPQVANALLKILTIF
jgi:hypothetical protein